MEKVEIHKIVEEPCELYGPGGEHVGKIEDVLSFYDVRVQIKEKALKGYYVVFKGMHIGIDTNGNLAEYPDGLFDEEINLLVKLV